jgi:predicted DNA-binding transcriptional regulator YafY
MLLTTTVSNTAYEASMRRADRLLRIIQILRRHRRPVKGQTMAEEVEVSLRTLYRDIADLINDGVPIRGEAGVGYVLGQGYDLPPLMFTTDEVEAVMLGLRWVMRRGDRDLVRAAEDAVAKVGTVLPQELRPVLFDTGLLVPPSWRAFDDTIDVAALRRAIREQRKVSISYRNEQGHATARIIWPFAISYFDAQRLIVAWCELRQAFRTFRTDRMSEAVVLPEKYRERRAVLLKRWAQEQGLSAPHDRYEDGK